MKSVTKMKIYFAKFSEDEILGMASSLAFSILISIIPLIAVGYYVFALLGGLQELRQTVETYAFQYIAPSLAESLTEYVRTIEQRVSPEALGVFGVVGFLYSALSMIGQAEWSLNKIWGVGSPRSFGKRLIRYTAAIVAAPILLGGSLAMTSYLASRVGELRYLSEVFVAVLTGVPYIFTSVLFAGIFAYLPNTKVNIRAAMTAGLITGLTFELLKQGFAYYASYSLQNSVYGSLAALPIMVLWIFLIGVVFLAGAELCYFIDQRSAGVFQFASQKSLLSLTLLRDIIKVYCHSTEPEPIGLKRLVSVLNWDQSVVLKHVHYLVEIGLLRLAKNQSRRSECFEAVDKDFVKNIQKLTFMLNRVRYEQIDLPIEPELESLTRKFPHHEKLRRDLPHWLVDSPIEVQ